MSLADEILGLLEQRPGLSDREITDALRGPGARQQAVNQECRALEGRGLLRRIQRSDGRLGNHPVGSLPISAPAASAPSDPDPLSEDSLKQALEKWLTSQEWQPKIAWGRKPGADIEARRGNERWIIEVKGRGSRDQMRVNYFLAVLGETLQRMQDEHARYSIALPDLKQFRGLWERLPQLAKRRTGITALFVDEQGRVSELAD